MQTKIIKGTGIVSLTIELNVRELILLSDAFDAFEDAEKAFKAKKAAEDAYFSIKNASEEEQQALEAANDEADAKLGNAIAATRPATRLYHGFVKEVLKDYQPSNEKTFQSAELEFL